jgi:hypothetical protein
MISARGAVIRSAYRKASEPMEEEWILRACAVMLSAHALARQISFEG